MEDDREWLLRICDVLLVVFYYFVVVVAVKKERVVQAGAG
jgi:hypothetical protein